jgi:hypothetical protein
MPPHGGRSLRVRGLAGSHPSVQRAGASRLGLDRLRPPSVRLAAWLLLRPAAEATTVQRRARARWLGAAPEVVSAVARIDAYRAMIPTREPSASGLHEGVTGTERGARQRDRRPVLGGLHHDDRAAA